MNVGLFYKLFSGVLDHGKEEDSRNFSHTSTDGWAAKWACKAEGLHDGIPLYNQWAQVHGPYQYAPGTRGQCLQVDGEKALPDTSENNCSSALNIELLLLSHRFE